jgi:hypothetical protein
MPASVETAAYFAVAECLANVVKHSRAAAAAVTLPKPRAACGSPSPTTAAAAPTRPAARACAASWTASTASRGAWTSPARARPDPGHDHRAADRPLAPP